ncbi:NACHT, LRR and PYD domains-containing protein 12-like isoform X2 [Engystomops pustulosus]|uniref:NACHT, LRR and PYD domains-containing protein 12-like isoform X2 n=1 Tax=Engystomops pustulosus TaxID=76066 RepID=UPI003AFAFA7D
MSCIISSDDDETRQFHHKLSQFDPQVLRKTYKYFHDDLLYILDDGRSRSLISQLKSRNILGLEKYPKKYSKKSLAWNLLQDIFPRGREALSALWVSLYVLQKEKYSPNLEALLEELRHRGDTLPEQIQLDDNGHQLPPELKEVQICHKKRLREITQRLIKHHPLRCNKERFPFRYLNLIIVSADHFSKYTGNELINTGNKHGKYFKMKLNDLQQTSANKLFRWSHRSRSVPHMVMVVGVAGVGKTTLMEKFIYSWCKGDLYQRFSFVFFYTFRELNRLDKVSLETMILQHYPYLEKQLGNILRDPKKLLFIFDGLDESNHTMDFKLDSVISDPKQLGSSGQIVVSLVRKSLLNGCSVLITSRPTRLTSIDCKVFQQIAELSGFFAEEIQIYFDDFFPDSDLAVKAFTYVKQNDSLYTFCYLPAYCWIICTVLSRCFKPSSSDQQVSSLPQTVTQLFAIFVTNILNLEKSCSPGFLQSIGWMAEDGVLNHKVIFDNEDLETFHVDNKEKLLSSFLIEWEEPASYSFLHLTLQEFFAALVHYVDYSPEKLKNSIKKAISYHDGRGEIFLRFLCGLTDASTRSILSSYLDKQADQASRDVMTWLKDHILKGQQLMESVDKRKHLLRTFFYLFETQNKSLVRESLLSDRTLDLSGVCMSAMDCTVVAFILDRNIKELDLSSCSLDSEGLERLAPALHNLHKLSLSYNCLSDTSCIHLASGIRNNSSLKILDLFNSDLSGPHLSDLMEALSSPGCRIEELRLAMNKLPDTSCIQLASVIRNNPSLTKLDLSNNNLSGPHLSDLMEALSSPGCRIKELRLRSNNLSEKSCIHLASGIKNNPSLKILDLSDNNMSGPYLSDLMEALSSPGCRIEELDLHSNNLPDWACTQLASAILNNPSLKILDLSFNHLSGPHISVLLDALSSPDCRIEKLDLSSNHLSDASCIQLASGIKNSPSLKILDLSWNCLSGPRLTDLMDALSSPGCRIEKLDLRSNKLADTSCIHLASGFRNNQSLKILDLTDNNLFGPKLSDLMEALSSPGCRVEELHLSYNGLNDSSCIPLASGIRNNPSLKILDLSWNVLGGNAAFNQSDNELCGPHFRDLMKALSSPGCRIENLDLSWNYLPGNCCIHLASGIRKNRSLKILDLHGNCLSGPYIGDLMEALSSPGCRIKELNLSYNNLPDSSYIQLVSGIQNNRYLKILVLSHNDLSGPHLIDLMEALSNPACRAEKLENFRLQTNQQMGMKSAKDVTSQKAGKSQMNMNVDLSCRLCGQEKDQCQVFAKVVFSTKGSTYRLEVKSPGLYRCPKTGIKFLVKDPVIIEYKLESWSDHLKNIPNSTSEILGPLFNIQVHGEPNAVSAVYLPHFLCFKAFIEDTSQIKCAHFKDGNMTMMTPTQIEPFYVTMENPTFSLLGVIMRLVRGRIPIHGIVLIYFTILGRGSNEEHRIHLYVLPNITNAEEALDKENKRFGYHRIKKPEQASESVYLKVKYLVRGLPDISICPETLKFQSERPQYTEIQLKQKDVDIFLFVSEDVPDAVSKDPVWKVHLTPNDMGNVTQIAPGVSHPGGACASVPEQSVHFVDEHRAYLIRMISVVDPVLDDLLGLKLLTYEQYQTIRSQNTNQEQMRRLYDYIRAWGHEDKDKIYQSLRKHNRPIIRRLVNRERAEHNAPSTLQGSLNYQAGSFMDLFKAMFGGPS